MMKKTFCLLLGFVFGFGLFYSLPLQAEMTGVSKQAEKILPSVVSIITVKDESKSSVAPKGKDWAFPYLQNSLIGKIPDADIQNIESLGSGFIVSKDGDVLTNAHVIEGASKIFVMLFGGKSYEAVLGGEDKNTDLALLKIKADKPLLPVTFGDSDKIKVGELAIAAGNPYGLGNTVSVGIVSAVARDIFAGPYDEFIQTDVAINKGSSGGPLFNSSAALIGVNTAIFSGDGSNSGISFAVPSATAESVYHSLKEFGKVKRGKIGVTVQPLTDENAKSLGLASGYGALVSGVEVEGSAARVGIEVGDVILKFGGKTVYNMRQFPKMVASRPVGEMVDIVIWCEGKEISTKVKIEELVEENNQEQTEQNTLENTLGEVDKNELIKDENPTADSKNEN